MYKVVWLYVTFYEPFWLYVTLYLFCITLMDIVWLWMTLVLLALTLFGSVLVCFALFDSVLLILTQIDSTYSCFIKCIWPLLDSLCSNKFNFVWISLITFNSVWLWPTHAVMHNTTQLCTIPRSYAQYHFNAERSSIVRDILKDTIYFKLIKIAQMVKDYQ